MHEHANMEKWGSDSGRQGQAGRQVGSDRWE